MSDLSGVFATLKLVSGVAVPLCLLSVALGRVDLNLLAGALLAFGGVFGIVVAYARYVDFDAEGPTGDRTEGRRE
jgi:hypothetical protein